eukprot:597847_1
MHRNIRNKRRKITKRDTILTAQSKMGASNDVTFRSKYRKKTKVLKHEYDPFKDVPIMDIERFIQVMGQLHDCDPSYPTVGNTQILYCIDNQVSNIYKPITSAFNECECSIL